MLTFKTCRESDQWCIPPVTVFRRGRKGWRIVGDLEGVATVVLCAVLATPISLFTVVFQKPLALLLLPLVPLVGIITATVVSDAVGRRLKGKKYFEVHPNVRLDFLEMEADKALRAVIRCPHELTSFGVKVRR